MDRILKIRNKLIEVLRFEYLDKKVHGAEFQRFVDICSESIAEVVRTPHRETLVDSLRHLAGVKFTETTIADTAHRLLGNTHRIRQRRKVVPWHGQRFFEWVPVQVMAVHRSRNERNEVGATLTLKFMAGSPCPLTTLQWWSLRKCRYLSRSIGFSRPVSQTAVHPAKYPYHVPEQLTTMRFMVLLDPTEASREPKISAIDSCPSTRKWNIAQLKRRARRDFECPKEYPRSLACHHCPIGYLTCPAATHRLDYVARPCPKCEREDAVWDTELPVNMCIECYMSTYVYIKKIEIKNDDKNNPA